MEGSAKEGTGDPKTEKKVDRASDVGNGDGNTLSTLAAKKMVLCEGGTGKVVQILPRGAGPSRKGSGHERSCQFPPAKKKKGEATVGGLAGEV